MALEGFFSGLWEYKWVVAFYLGIVLFVYLNRRKFQFQAKVVALYRTKLGLKLMDKIGVKHSELVKLLGYIGIGIGFVGMVVIMFFIFKGIFDMMFVPGAPPVISPVLPGVPIPGSPIQVPLVYGILALFIVIVVHEFSHGVVARAHNLRVKSSGIVFFGPIIGAFVEPDEKQLKKQSEEVKYSIYAAGPFSNVLLAIIVVLFTLAVTNPLVDAIARPAGVSFTNIEEGMPADLAGLSTDVTYNQIGNMSIMSVEDLETAFLNVKVNDTIIIGDGTNTHYVTTTSRPENPDKAVIGVNLVTRYTNEDSWYLAILLWIQGLLSWTFMLSLGLGLANLLPLGPVDGGRMIHEALSRIYGEKKGTVIWAKMAMALLVVILVLLFVPILRAVF